MGTGTRTLRVSWPLADPKAQLAPRARLPLRRAPADSGTTPPDRKKGAGPGARLGLIRPAARNPRVSPRHGHASVSSGFILTYTTSDTSGAKNSARCTERAGLGVRPEHSLPCAQGPEKTQPRPDATGATCHIRAQGLDGVDRLRQLPGKWSRERSSRRGLVVPREAKEPGPTHGSPPNFPH